MYDKYVTIIYVIKIIPHLLSLKNFKFFPLFFPSFYLIFVSLLEKFYTSSSSFIGVLYLRALHREIKLQRVNFSTPHVFWSVSPLIPLIYPWFLIDSQYLYIIYIYIFIKRSIFFLNRNVVQLLLVLDYCRI